LLQRRRAAVFFMITAAIFAALAGRLAFLQFVRGPELRQRALEVRLRDVPVEARRGTIYDRQGRPLAVSIDVDSVYAIPAQVRDKAGTAARLAEILELDQEWVLGRLSRKESFTWIKRKVTSAQATAIRQAKLRGVDMTQEAKRVYPKGSLACHVIGFAGIDSQGLEGLEYQYDATLRGVQGWISVEYDARGQEIPQAVHRYIEPTDGTAIVLTIDETIQYICERELAKAVASTGAKGGTVILMDPRNGEVLALANYPYYDLNNYQAADVSFRRNAAVADTYSPGSTFKPVTAAAALEERLVSWSESFFCAGSLQVPGRRVGCWQSRGHGSQTLTKVIQNSCNVGFMQIAFRLGVGRFYDYVEAFGLTAKTGIDLPGEASGLIVPRSKAKPLDLAVMSFGQSLTVTPLQLLNAICAIANGGTVYQPHLVRELRGPDGKVLRTLASTVARQVIAGETARELNLSLQATVEDGTGRRAFIPGYELAGKTGTAQKVVAGRVSSESHVSSFIGFGPTRDPQVAALVVLDEPTGAIYGGQVAAPVFQAIMQDVYRYLGIPVLTR
jgi:stage V sporulation protein D (sporulation-specific penicillin-binding protein)